MQLFYFRLVSRNTRFALFYSQTRIIRALWFGWNSTFSDEKPTSICFDSNNALWCNKQLPSIQLGQLVWLAHVTSHIAYFLWRTYIFGHTVQKWSAQKKNKGRKAAGQCVIVWINLILWWPTFEGSRRRRIYASSPTTIDINEADINPDCSSFKVSLSMSYRGEMVWPRREWTRSY